MRTVILANPEKPTTPEMEAALVHPFKGAFPFKSYFVLPRVAYGLKGIEHECDLLALSKSGVLHEIEIKISKADLLADKRKRHTHRSELIKRLWFAVPSHMKDFAKDHIPADAGLIVVEKYFCEVVRMPKHKGKDKPNAEFIKHMYELMAMRYWSERVRKYTKQE